MKVALADEEIVASEKAMSVFVWDGTGGVWRRAVVCFFVLSLFRSPFYEIWDDVLDVIVWPGNFGKAKRSNFEKRPLSICGSFRPFSLILCSHSAKQSSRCVWASWAQRPSSKQQVAINLPTNQEESKKVSITNAVPEGNPPKQLKDNRR